MTLPSATVSVTAQADGATLQWAYNFPIPFQADGATPAVVVFTTDANGVNTYHTLNVDFSITGVGSAEGGLVNFPINGGPLLAPNTITIARDLANLQVIPVANVSFYPHTVEEVADQAGMQIQQLAAQAVQVLPGELALTFPAGDDWEIGDLLAFDGMKLVATKLFTVGDLTDAEIGQIAIDNGAASQVELDALEENVAAIATAALSGDTYAGLDPREVVDSQSQANLADPNVTDPSLTNPAFTDQIYRAWQTTDGSLSSQSSVSFPNLSALRRYPVVSGQTYTISIYGAPSGFSFYMPGPKIGFYDNSHTFTSFLTTFTQTPAVLPLSITFVAPNTGFVGFNLQDSANGSVLPASQARLDLAINAVNLNLGSTALPFEPFFSGVFAPTDAIFQPPLAGQIVVVLQVAEAYIRTACQQSPDTDLVRHLSLGETPNQAFAGLSGSSPGGCVDTKGYRFISKTTSAIGTVEAYNRAVEVQAGTDESAAFKANGMAVGGNHATIAQVVTVAGGHSKTNVDVGSVYADATPTNWIIGAVLSTTQLIMEVVNSGTSTAWDFNGSITGSTFTHVSGGTHTGNFSFTAPALEQLYPLNARYVMEAVLDGEVLYTTAYGLVATAGGGNTGNGTLTNLTGAPPAGIGNYTLTFTSSTAFGVTDPNGVSIGTGALPGSSAGQTVLFSAAGIQLQVTAGSVAFVNTDTFTIVSTQTYTGASGVFAGKEFVINEVYSILNPASQQTSLIANVGANPPNYVRSDIDEQFRVFFQWIWNQWGAVCIGGQAVSPKQDFNRQAPLPNTPFGDFFTGLQLQRMDITTDTPPGIATNIELYVPNTPNQISGYLFQDFADVTSSPVTVLVPVADCADPTHPASHFCQRAKLSGNVLWGEVYGIDSTYELGLPANASTMKANVMFFIPNAKQFPVMLDYTAGNGVAGVDMVGRTFRAAFLPTDPDLDIPGVIVTMGGVNYCYITAHKVLANKSVAVPAALDGLPITVIKSDANVTILDNFVNNGAIRVTGNSSYWDVVLRLG